MNSDIATLQSISDTLKENPLASQRILAKNAGMSIGLMNAVLKRFVERGWIMLSNVNLKKFSYALTPAGITELTKRSRNFARRTFEIANKYNEKICNVVADAKKSGKSCVVLYGQSYIKFLLVYACQKFGIEFVEKDITSPVEKENFCIAGELNEEESIADLEKKGCVSLLNFLDE